MRKQAYLMRLRRCALRSALLLLLLYVAEEILLLLLVIVFVLLVCTDAGPGPRNVSEGGLLMLHAELCLQSVSRSR